MIRPGSGELVLRLHDRMVLQLEWAQSARVLAFLGEHARSRRGVTLYNPSTGESRLVAMQSSSASIRRFSISDDARHLITCSDRITLYDLDEGAPRELEDLSHEQAIVAIRPDGRQIAAAIPERPIVIVELDEEGEESGRRELGEPLEHPLTQLVYSPNGAEIFGIGRYGRFLMRMDTTGGATLPMAEVYTPFVARYSTDGEWLALTGYTGRVTVLDVQSGEQVYQDNGHRYARAYGLAWSEDGRLFSGGDDGVLVGRSVQVVLD